MTKNPGLSAAIVPVTPFQQNCTLIWDGVSRQGVVIDPGGDVDRIVEAIGASGIDVQAIWLTHGHLDHVGGAEALKRRLGVPIIGPHIADEPLCSGIERQAEMFGVPGQYHNVHPDRWLEEGDTVSFGGHDFEVFHCPGHAPGHVVFYNRAARFAHVGDVLFSGSVGRTDLPGGDHQALIDSIRTKLLPLGDDVGFICGHGPGSTIGRERQTNPFLQDE
ncbi:MBL fold metallo-hydrolase [bacterium]|nr:MBL fold metallo-hydrolase [bacterium]